MKSCWNQDGKLRPAASEIVEFLANNPRLISPCLDVPLSSVQTEESDQLEINIPTPCRKFSSSFNFKSSLPNGFNVESNSPPVHLQQQPLTDNEFFTQMEIISPPITARQLSIPDSGICLQMDTCCVREPLLQPIRANSTLGLGKYVSSRQHDKNDSGCEQGDQDDFFPAQNGHAISIL